MKELGTLRVPTLAGDPASPVNGQIWYDTTENEFRCRRNGVNKDLESFDPTSQAAAAITLNGAARQPSTDRHVEVTFCGRITYTDNEDGTIVLQRSADNVTYRSVGSALRGKVHASGVLGAQANGITEGSITATIPAGWWYKITTTTTSGSPTFAIVSNEELTL